MLSKALYVLAFVCVIQEILGRPQQDTTKLTPVQEAIERINPELDRISLRLQKLKLNIHQSLLRSLKETHESLSELGGKILEAINQLQFNTSEIAKIANKSNIDIESCVCRQRAKLERVLMVANSKTKKTSEESQLQANNFTQKANELVKEAEDIDKNINKIIGYCIRQNNLAWQQEKLIECLFNEASYVNKKVDQLCNQKDLIDSGRNALTNNITTIQGNLLKWISTLQEEFFKCVSQSQLYSAEEPQEVQISGSEDMGTLRKPDRKEAPHLDFAEANQTVLNFHQQVQTIEYKPEKPQTIFERIRKLEFLLDRLKQLHQLEDIENIDKSSSFSKEGGLGPNPTEFEENKASEQNRRFILYISF